VLVVDAAPFAGLRHDPAVAGPPARTSAPAQDDLAPLDYLSRLTASPYTVLHLFAGHDGGEPPASVVARWERLGVLRAEPTPAMYRYEQHWLANGVPQVLRGVLAAVSARGAGGRRIAAHEHVDHARLDAGRRRRADSPVEAAPVTLLVDGADPAWRAPLDAAPPAPPVAALTDEVGADHRLWRLPVEASIRVRAALGGARAVIADGHHRWRAAREQNAPGDEADPAGRVLALLTDPAASDGPRLAPVHLRLDRPPNDPWRVLPAAALAAAGAGTQPETAALRPPGTGSVVCWSRGQLPVTIDLVRLLGEQMRSAPGEWTRAVREWLLPRLGISGSEVTPTADLAQARSAVLQGQAEAVVAQPPLAIAEVVGSAGAGRLLPAKSTRFWPKPRVGLVLRRTDAGAGAATDPATGRG